MKLPVAISTIAFPVIALLFSGNLLASGICVPGDTQTLHCIYNNFGPSGAGDYQADVAWQTGGGLIVAYQQVAIPFQANGSYYLNNLEVAVSRVSGSVADSIHFSIFNNVGGAPASGGSPGSSLESFALTGLGYPGGTPPQGTVTVASSLHPLLMSGLFYWVVMTDVNSGGDIVWNYNSSGALGAEGYLPPNASNGDPAAWGAYASYTQGAVALDGTPALPEPSTWLLLAGGLMAAARTAGKRSSLK